MPRIGEIASLSSTGLGIALPLLTSLTNPVSAAIAAGAGLLALVDKIGQGRKAANKFTGKGGPQDIINKQLAAISVSQASAEEKSQATSKAWKDFLDSANQFAAANPKQAQVVKQAIYQTPELTNTVKTLLGRDPLDASYTEVAAPGMATGFAGKNPGPSIGGTVLQAGLTAGIPFAVNALKRRSISQVANPGVQSIDMSTVSPSTGPPIKAPPIFAANQPPGGGTQSLLERLLPQLVSGGTSLIGGLIASRAAGKAADVQADATDQSAQLQREAARESIQFSRDALRQQQQNIQPWIDAGTGALRTIGDITNAPGYGYTKTFTPPTPDEAMQDPGIQFQLQQGQRALEAYLRSSGLSLSGKAVKDITKFGQDVAATGYQNVYNRRRGEFEQDYNLFANERQARLNPELSLAGLGQTSVGQLNSDVGNAGNNISNITMGTARGVGDATTQGAQARASGYAAGGNIWGSTIADIANNIRDQRVFDQIMRRLNG